ncbi:MAG: SDR family NAD(P)-dependent oxidoreductase [Solirubrobacterales bacterium]
MSTTPGNEKLAGKTAFITGAGSGMGRAMARRFAAEGARVAAADIDADRADAVAAEIRGNGGTASAFTIDVADSASVGAAVDAALAEMGPVDILCSNAGILDDYATVLETSEEQWDRVLGINLKGMYLTSRALLPQMIDNGRGVIVNTASIAGMVAGGGGAAYTAAKHGVIGLTRQLAFDFGPKGVRANAICPGAVETGMTHDLFEAGEAEVMDSVNSVPAGRYAQPEEIANLALFLAGDESDFIHGAAYVIDGGWTVR